MCIFWFSVRTFGEVNAEEEKWSEDTGGREIERDEKGNPGAEVTPWTRC